MSSWVVRARSCCAVVALSSLMAGGVGCVSPFLRTRSITFGTRSITERALVSLIKQGKTTKDEVRLLFGDPTGVSVADAADASALGSGFSEGDEGWFFLYGKTTRFPFVPLMGSESFTKMVTLTVVFDSSGVVKLVEHGASKGGSGKHAIFK